MSEAVGGRNEAHQFDTDYTTNNPCTDSRGSTPQTRQTDISILLFATGAFAHTN